MDIHPLKTDYIKNIYFNVGKSIMDYCFCYSKQYINYKHLNKLYCQMHNCPYESHIMLNDCYGAFVTALCTKLCSEINCCDTVIIVIDPYFNETVICQMYVPYKKLYISNSIYSNPSCKDYKLYTNHRLKSIEKNHTAAMDFFKKYQENKK